MPFVERTEPTRNFPKGGWKARYRDGDGKFHSKTFPRRSDAERYLAQIRVDLDNQDYIDPKSGRTTFATVADQWWALRPATKDRVRYQYGRLLQRHVLPHFGHRPVAAITPTEIRAWAANLPIKPDNAFRNVLKPILALAVEMNLIRKNPAQGLSLPKRPVTLGETGQPGLVDSRSQGSLFLSAEEVDLLAKHLATVHEPYGLLVYFAAYTGLRAGEIGALRVRHLDLLRKQVTVASSVSGVPGKPGLIYGPTKTGKARVVNLPTFLVDGLAAYLSSHPARQADPTLSVLDPDELVFRSVRGAPLRHTGFYERYFKPAVRASLPKHLHGLRFHDLRHTCASLLINPPISANVLAVAKHLGHSDPSITLREV
jgi:integrase